MPKRSPTKKQQAWLERYLANGFNASEAARFAGYKHPRQCGYENLSKHYIRDVIEDRLAELTISANEVLARMSLEARGEAPTSRIVTSDGEQLRYDTLRAQEILAKHHALLKDRVEHSWEEQLEQDGIPRYEAAIAWDDFVSAYVDLKHKYGRGGK